MADSWEILKELANYKVERKEGGYEPVLQSGSKIYQNRVLHIVSKFPPNQEEAWLTDDPDTVLYHVKKEEGHPPTFIVSVLGPEQTIGTKLLVGTKKFLRFLACLLLVAVGVVLCYGALLLLKQFSPELYAQLGLATSPRQVPVEVEKLPVELEKRYKQLADSGALSRLKDLRESLQESSDKALKDKANNEAEVTLSFTYQVNREDRTPAKFRGKAAQLQELAKFLEALEKYFSKERRVDK